MLSGLPIFDAHLDLAMLAELGRDLHAPLDDCRGALAPAAVTLPSLRDGNVRACLGTIFTEAIKPGGDVDREYQYPMGDKDAAYRAGMRQLKLYQAWEQGGAISLMNRRVAEERGPSDGTPTSASPVLQARSVSDGSSSEPPMRLGVLVECADPIGSPDELPEWVDGGVVAIGMAWWHEGRYAGGNGSDNKPLTDLGRALIPAMDALGVVHDLSHLSQRSVDQLLEATDVPVIASHSNCRALLPGDNHRHVADEVIKEIAHRGGLVGVNLVRNFLDPTLAASKKPIKGDATIDQVCDHIEHVCALAGDRRHVGLGTDMDGGITADDLPKGIDTPSDLPKIFAALGERGWSDDDLMGVAWGNWARFWGIK